MIAHPNRSKKTRKIAAAPTPADTHDHDYSGLLLGVEHWFQPVASAVDSRLFCTDATGLNDAYLDNLPLSLRQIHNCTACRRFIEQFGGLAWIDPTSGALRSAIWNPDFVANVYETSFSKMAEIVEQAKVTGPFKSVQRILGTPQTKKWRHISIAQPPDMIYRERALNADQAMAAARENHKTVKIALAAFPPAALDQALRILDADAVSRAEKFVGPVRWLRALQNRPKGSRGDNVLWHAIAFAPEGYCHPRASVVGSLLEDIEAGLAFEDIKRRFDAKLHPLKYQRPQAAPAAGNIAQAEKLVEKLGIQRSLERRFARLDEIIPLWLPDGVKPKPSVGGVFGHLKVKHDAPALNPVDLPGQTMTWVKFVADVLPRADAISLLVPAHGNFSAMTTAAHADAPPILKWDMDDARNPVSLYVYHNGSPASRWRLSAGWRVLSAITAFPWLWRTDAEHQGLGAVLIIAGAADKMTGQGNGLFPEQLKNELHGVRATIEAYSKTAVIGGLDEASACGLSIGKGKIGARLKVIQDGAASEFLIDRWD